MKKLELTEEEVGHLVHELTFSIENIYFDADETGDQTSKDRLRVLKRILELLA